MASSSPGNSSPTESVTMMVNDQEVTHDVEPRWKLSDFLRYLAGQTDVRVGCEQGACGACTILLDGKTVKSCMLFAVQADDAHVKTAAHLNLEEGLHPIQEAFTNNHALQCGFCTSGMIVATKALLDRNPDPDREDIEEGLADNICRCTGYVNIVDAVEDAADSLRSAPRVDGGETS